MGGLVAIVIPIYKSSLTPYEMISLKQCVKVLGNHPIIVVRPQSLVLDFKDSLGPYTEVAFADHFFKDIQGYNRLMLSQQFYAAFLKYEHMLIYQLDAFVFRDDLLKWCNKGYDYIGAPWLYPNAYSDVFKALKSYIQIYIHTRFNLDEDKSGIPSEKQRENKVGNGGFSLRRVKLLHDLIPHYKQEIDIYNQQQRHQYNEDVFWSIEVNRKKKVLRIPHYRDAVHFALESHPERSLKLIKQQLPFGCHAWDLHVDFWRPIFAELGYPI